MSISHKSSNTQVFRLMLYSRALHPELFDLQVRSLPPCTSPNMKWESWITPAGHILRFQVDGKSSPSRAGKQRPPAGDGVGSTLCPAWARRTTKLCYRA